MSTRQASEGAQAAEGPASDALPAPGTLSFFDAAKFQTITYRGRGICRTEEGWVVDGTLTIREASQVVPVRFAFRGAAAAESGKPTRVAFRAHADTKRADFAMMRNPSYRQTATKSN